MVVGGGGGGGCLKKYIVVRCTVHTNCLCICRFPLYLRGSEKALFLYAIHLFNKDIGQVCVVL